MFRPRGVPVMLNQHMPLNNHEAYDTHLNYVRCLANLVSPATLTYNNHLRQATLPYVGEKQNLISLTRQSLNDENQIVQIDRDYSYASTSWLPIKSYYLVFNILLTIQYILTLQRGNFRMGHLACVDEFTRKLQAQEIQFSDPTLNQVFDGSILSYRSVAGANLSSRTSSTDMYKLVMKKIAKYKEEDWRRQNRINLRVKVHRDRFASYMSNKFSVSIFDFSYFMRIRSNYRDFAFIDGISSTETAAYFSAYFRFSMEFVRMLESMKITLANERLTGI